MKKSPYLDQLARKLDADFVTEFGSRHAFILLVVPFGTAEVPMRYVSNVDWKQASEAMQSYIEQRGGDPAT